MEQQKQKCAAENAESKNIVIISRKEAQAKGIKRYFTGKPCKYGHVDERNTVTSKCVTCSREKAKNEKESRLDYFREYYRTEKYKERKRALSSTEEQKEKKRIRERERYNENKDKYRKKAMEKYWKNRDKILENKSKRMKDRWKNDLEFRVSNQLRTMVSRCFRMTGKKKASKTEKYLGYSVSDLISHVERQFIGDMKWDNWGEVWELDHIIPISKMIEIGITDPSEINALPNLKPIYKQENRAKKDKILYLI